MHEKNDLNQLLKDKNNVPDVRVISLLKTLQNEYITEFGVSKNYANYLKKQIQIEIVRINILKTGDKSLQNMIDILEIELAQLTNTEESKGYQKTKITIEKYMNRFIDVKIISTFDYYSYVKEIEAEIKNGK